MILLLGLLVVVHVDGGKDGRGAQYKHKHKQGKGHETGRMLEGLVLHLHDSWKLLVLNINREFFLKNMSLHRRLHKCKDGLSWVMKNWSWAKLNSILVFGAAIALLIINNAWAPVTFIVCTSVLVWNVPNFVPSLHRRPIY
ncbi:MAG: hypothetical protein K0U52_03665, partial [Gammaproteobacteria bacterium]|nr:hypothetical protein [Gammaproteobacteria bacterium]